MNSFLPFLSVAQGRRKLFPAACSILLLYLLCDAAALRAQTTWNGNAGTNWNNAANWSAGVPTAAVHAIIPNVANDPVIQAGTAAVANSVNVQTGGSLTIQATGSLTINGFYNYVSSAGLLNSGTVSNSGRITLGSTGSVGDYGIWNLATFNNNTGGVIGIDRSTLIGLCNFPGTFNNSGKITIGALVSTGVEGIRNIQQATFNNNNGGEIFIDRSTLRGIVNLSSVFTNSGKISIGASADVGGYGLWNEATFNNNAGGEISANRATDRGLYNLTGTFTNSGKISIGSLAGVGPAGLWNEATFNNNSGGEIRIEHSTDIGLFNDLGAVFSNSSKIAIRMSDGVGQNGLLNWATFNNNGAGQIDIDRAAYSGLYNEYGIFTNAAKIRIGSTAGAGDYGLLNEFTFHNNSGGEINIDSSATIGLFNRRGINYLDCAFNNAGEINIGSATAVGTHGLWNEADFNNAGSGDIHIDRSTTCGLLNMNGAFTNAGKITIGSIAGVGADGLVNDEDMSNDLGGHNDPDLQKGLSGTIPVSFQNNSGGEIRIDRSAFRGLANLRGIFTNEAKIAIGAVAAVGNYGLSNESSFYNNSGSEISIDRSSNTALVNGNGFFVNSSKIIIGSLAGVGSTGVHNSATFINSSCSALLNIVADAIFQNDFLDFYNYGIIIENASGNSSYIDDNQGIVQNLNGGTFSINTGNSPISSPGTIWTGCVSTDWNDPGNWHTGAVPTASDHVIVPFNNFQPTIIAAGTAAEAQSVDLQPFALLTIQAAGNLTVNGSFDYDGTAASLRNQGTLSNSGRLALGAAAGAGAYGLWNEADFQNNTCAETFLYAPLLNTSPFTNNGLLFSNTAGAHSNTALTNNGILAYPPGNPIPNVANHEIVVAPATSNSCQSVSPAFGLGAPVDLTITGVFTDDNATLPAGTYTAATNTFTPAAPLSEGVYEYFVKIEDGAGMCTRTVPWKVTADGCDNTTNLSGTIKWHTDSTLGVNTTVVTLGGSAPGNMTTGTNGHYSFATGVASGTFTITPAKNTNKLNGVTVADVTAIQQHVTNIAPLPGPYRRIAADVNKSNSISTLDATLINQALLGNPAALNQITSWRFVPSAYTFPNPNVPWGFPEKITLNNVSGNVAGQDFLGIKLGDVAAAWANPANFGQGEPLVLRLHDQTLEAGAELEARLRADQLDDLAAFQFALRFDPAQLQLVAAIPEGAFPLTEANIGLHGAAEGEIRIVWAQAEGLPLHESAPLFRLRFKALQSGVRLSEALRLNPEALPGYCYNSALAESGVRLEFDGMVTYTHQAEARALQLNTRPNPATEMVWVRFDLEQATEATLSILDLGGRLVYEQPFTAAAGENSVPVRVGELTAGLYLVQLRAGAQRGVEKLVVAER